MPYYILSGSYCDPLPMPMTEVDALLPSHKEFIQRGIKDNRILFAGPKKSGNGGFVVAKAETRAALEDYISSDPYFQKGILHFDITEFAPLDYQPYIEQWL